MARTPSQSTPTNKGKPEIGTWGFDLAGHEHEGRARRELLPVRERRLAQEHADPRRQVELRHVHGALRSQRRAHQGDHPERERRRRARGARRSPTTTQRSWTRPRSRGRASSRSRPTSTKINAIKDDEGARSRAFASNSRHFGASAVRDDRRRRTTRTPRQHIAIVAQGGLGLPDRDMYDAKNKQFEPLRAGYKKYIAAMFTLLGAKDADEAAPRRSTRSRRRSRPSHWTRVAEPRPAEDVQQAHGRRARRSSRRASTGSRGSTGAGLGKADRTSTSTSRPRSRASRSSSRASRSTCGRTT